jgi:hypothetical protein
MLTVPLAPFGHIDDMLREHLASIIAIAIDLKRGLVSLDHPPRILCATQNMDGVRIKCCQVFLEIPDVALPCSGGSTTGLSATDAWWASLGDG